MNFRKAKKRIKKKWRIKKWPGNLPPRLVDDFYTKMFAALSTAIDRAILYGDSDQHKIPIGLTEDIK